MQQRRCTTRAPALSDPTRRQILKGARLVGAGLVAIGFALVAACGC